MTEQNNLLTVSPSPHIKSPVTTTVIMSDVLIALVPALIWACYIFGMRSLYITLISVISCVGFEFLYEKLLKKPVTVGDLSAAVTGVLLAFNLPVTIPFWMPIAGAFFAIVIVKQLFGGIGKNIVNPALAARVFLFSWPIDMTTFTTPVKYRFQSFFVQGNLDEMASATPLSYLKNGQLPSDAENGYTILDLFIGNVPGVIGEVSALLLMIGFLYLLVRRVTTWHIPVAYIGTVALLTLVFARNSANVSFMWNELFSGGLFLGALFMANDYATSPVTKNGRLIYGVGCGLITVFIRFFASNAEGVSYSILIMNLLVWYLDRFTKPVRFGGGKHAKQ